MLDKLLRLSTAVCGLLARRVVLAVSCRRFQIQVLRLGVSCHSQEPLCLRYLLQDKDDTVRQISGEDYGVGTPYGRRWLDHQMINHQRRELSNQIVVRGLRPIAGRLLIGYVGPLYLTRFNRNLVRSDPLCYPVPMEMLSACILLRRASTQKILRSPRFHKRCYMKIATARHEKVRFEEFCACN